MVKRTIHRKSRQKNDGTPNRSQFTAICREYWAHLRYFEYWPTRLFYLPIYTVVLYWTLRLRSLAFMTVVNPCMEFGGLLNYSKSKILAALPPEKTLRSCLVSCLAEPAIVSAEMSECGLEYPIIAKPDFGERGFGVKVLHSEEQLVSYLENFCRLSTNGKSYDIILQEYFHPTQEFTVLYSIAPGEAAHGELGQIRSICAKQPLRVEGDGRSCLWQLIAHQERAAKRFRLLRKMWQHRWFEVLPLGQHLQLTHIGAHSQGTDCYSAQERNSSQLLQIFASLTQNLNPEWRQGKLHFCFGRYDILARDWNAVLRGEFKVIELNGVNAEPIHIYQPKLPLWQGWKTLWQHWQRIGQLAGEMREHGHRPCSSRALIAAIHEHDRKINRGSGVF
ncbi:hypothetical protein P0082_03830 [Candidatus Haliotispira prima]|uniref:ATP-grasp domain-containing protein n=1 Tax=Candidatus Haliotispira prima TaxID=3034016 RepID=A0ABY8MML7_9SPIO|nr:hypothetical protein P0082_03830 [Candidatus Haliotispira prima]